MKVGDIDYPRWNIIYGDLPVNERTKLNTKAYSDYYSSCFEEDDFGFAVEIRNPALTFNQWFGTDIHKRFLNPYLRKLKLDKINNAD